MNALSIAFVVAFIGGLVLAVFAMLHGVEYTRPNRSRAPSPFFNLPAVAAFAVGFGAAGYPLSSRTRLPTWGVLLIAVAVGGVATSGMITLLAKWALRDVSDSLGDEQEIQGQLAVVTTAITPQSKGEISYGQLGATMRVPARSLNDAVIPAGTDVVIDRIEDGTAFVEEWAIVEQRL
ncbi:MAG TPA: NfeD family protein [Gemmatimonadaceae bacterium]|nr:NfeD family protein [Gemmatimonadaceae bacterium]